MRQIVCRERHLEQVCCVFTLIAIACPPLQSVSQQHRVKNIAQRVNGINDSFSRGCILRNGAYACFIMFHQTKSIGFLCSKMFVLKFVNQQHTFSLYCRRHHFTQVASTFRYR